MGKGDKKSKKGKRFRHSYGKTRLRRKKNAPVIKKKIEEKPKPVEQKKQFRPETVHEQPAVVTQVVEEVKIAQPQITEIKEEVQIPQIIETPISVVPEVLKEEIKEVPKPEVQEKALPETESKEVKEKPAADAPKKRGRPKKKE